jgi:hypothetical protein
MMEKIELKYRTWHKGIPPQPIKLQIPGWAGINRDHSSGAIPQPWHCVPFIDGSTYGLELLYPFETECHVYVKDEKLVFAGEWEKETLHAVPTPPFQAFAPGHFGFTSSLDIKAPPGYIIRVESHPRFYTDTTYTCPVVVPGHIQSEWWPKIFFIVFKAPMPGQTYIFRKNEPYGQIMVLPRRVSYEINEMTPAEIHERMRLEEKIIHYNKYFIKNKWVDHVGNTFDDKYRQLSSAYAKNGLQGIQDLLNAAIEEETEQKIKREEQNRSRFKRRLL